MVFTASPSRKDRDASGEEGEVLKVLVGYHSYKWKDSAVIKNVIYLSFGMSTSVRSRRVI